MHLLMRLALFILPILSIVGSSLGYAQPAYPNRPIRLVIPFGPGGSTSVVARLVTQRLTETLGQSIIVDNRPGGNGFIGGEVLVRSAADGYTLILVTSTHVITPLLASAPYDVVKDFTPIGTLCSSEFVLVVHPSLPVKNLREFIVFTKGRPGQLNFASSGSGSSTHVSSELLFLHAGIKLQHIPYKGAGQSTTDLIGGHVQVLFTAPINVQAHIRSGRVRALAYSGDNRLETLSEVPTLAEAGLPGFSSKAWYGILGPAGTPRPIVERLASELSRIVSQVDVKSQLLAQGMTVLVTQPDKFLDLIKSDTAKYAKVIKLANIRLDS